MRERKGERRKERKNKRGRESAGVIMGKVIAIVIIGWPERRV